MHSVTYVLGFGVPRAFSVGSAYSDNTEIVQSLISVQYAGILAVVFRLIWYSMVRVKVPRVLFGSTEVHESFRSKYITDFLIALYCRRTAKVASNKSTATEQLENFQIQ